MIEAYTVVWNEEKMLPYYLKHYRQLGDVKFTVFNQGSTDRTKEIAQDLGAKVVDLDYPLMSNQLLNNVANNCWKQSKADWVIMGDVDEWLNIHPYNLDECEINKETHIKGTGYAMVGDTDDFDEVTDGVLDRMYNKTIMFKPTRIKEMNYTIGCHSCNPVGDKIKESFIQPALYHMRYPSLKYVLERYRAY